MSARFSSFIWARPARVFENSLIILSPVISS
jgi:hypothetical protein